MKKETPLVVKYLVSSFLALISAIAFVAPATAAPGPSISASLTCERGTGATAQILAYNDLGPIIGYTELTCGIVSLTGARADRERVALDVEPAHVSYAVTLNYPDQPQPGCSGIWTVPLRVDCPGGDWAGPNVSVAVR